MRLRSGKRGLDDHDPSPDRVYVGPRRDARTQSLNRTNLAMTVAVVALSLILRHTVSMHPYSGEHSPPMYGDYEAQRHWMEITTHLPISEWYHNSSQNDLQYWGLDYPPLTAYHSWVCGLVGSWLEPEAFALSTSRGWETPASRLFMRGTVLLADVVLYVPVVLLAVHWCLPNMGVDPTSTKGLREMLGASVSPEKKALLVLLLQPALILVDHGHFQYNNISLALALLGMVLVSQHWDLSGSVFFCLALCYKQMSLYYALPFFFYLLGKAWFDPTCPILRRLVRVCLLGVVVAATLGLCWAPFLGSQDQLRSVLGRIFPTGRGLFEDKVASFWCAVSPFIKFKKLLGAGTLVPLCAGITLANSLPANVRAFTHGTLHGPHTFFLALFATAMSFFMFSFHVHEKTILVPLLPATCLCLRYPFLSAWMNVVASFSLFPLLERDRVVLPYVVLVYLVFLPLVWREIWDVPSEIEERVSRYVGPATSVGVMRGVWSCAIGGSLATMAMLHMGMATISPPARLPNLWPQLFAMFSFAQFLCLYVYSVLLLFSSRG